MIHPAEGASLLQVKTLTTPSSSGKAPAEVTQIAVGRSDSHQIAVGHADGTVSIKGFSWASRINLALQDLHSSTMPALTSMGRCMHSLYITPCCLYSSSAASKLVAAVSLL